MEFNKTNIKQYVKSLGYGKVVDIDLYINDLNGLPQATVITIENHIIWEHIVIYYEGEFRSNSVILK